MACFILSLRLCSARGDAQGETLLPPLKKGDRGGFDFRDTAEKSPLLPFVNGGKLPFTLRTRSAT